MILDGIVAAKRRAHAARDARAVADLRDRVERGEVLLPVRSLAAAIANGPRRRAGASAKGAANAPRSSQRPSVIAEFKRRSPSAGDLRKDAPVGPVAAAYAAAGAVALSILTDEEFFGGRLDDLAAARAAAPLPLLRKDFLLDEIDVHVARAAGADAVLLIARILDDAALATLHAAARRLGMDALVEVHDERELDRALAAGATLVGVNHRDLDTLAIDLSLSERLAQRVPAGTLLVAESGLRTGRDLWSAIESGCDAALIGETLLKQPSPGDALRALLDEATPPEIPHG